MYIYIYTHILCVIGYFLSTESHLNNMKFKFPSKNMIFRTSVDSC